VGVTMNVLLWRHDVNALVCIFYSLPFHGNDTYIQHANMLTKDSTPAIQAILSLMDVVSDGGDNNNNNKKNS
jgi:hypothetical protein